MLRPEVFDNTQLADHVKLIKPFINTPAPHFYAAYISGGNLPTLSKTDECIDITKIFSLGNLPKSLWYHGNLLACCVETLIEQGYHGATSPKKKLQNFYLLHVSVVTRSYFLRSNLSLDQGVHGWLLFNPRLNGVKV